jgi:glycosyltransferase involved in cell wall biosynthesis
MASSGPRVALVLASSTGGIGRHLASLAEGLHRLDHEVAVFGPQATGTLFDFAGRGAEFVPVPMPDVRALRRSLLAWRPDVVHAHGLRAGLVADLARRRTVPLVVTWHNAVLAGGLRGQVAGLAQRRVARAADVTLGASPDLVTRARELGARDARLGEVGAPDLPAPRRSVAEVRDEFGAAPGQPLVLSVGRLHPQKGYHILIEAAARWRRRTPPPIVVVAGSGPSYLTLAAQVSAARAPVTLLGHRDDVADLLAAADLAVVSSVWEARQLFAQEAMRAGVPLVATAVGGLPELVGDGALLVPSGSVDDLDAAVTALLDDAERRRDLAARGLARARLWPTEEQTVRQVSEVYAELVARREPAAEV